MRSLLDIFKNLFKTPVTRGLNTGTTTNPPSSWMGGFGWSPVDTGVPQNHLSSLQCSVVYSAVKNISDDLAKLPVKFKRKLKNGGYEEAEDHPMTSLLWSPNDFMTAFDFWNYAVTSYVLRGNSFVHITRDEDGHPTRLLPLSPDSCYQHVLEDGEIYYNLFHRELGNRIEPAENIIHVKNISIDGYTGISPIAVSQNVVGIAVQLQKHAATIFARGAMLRGVLKTPGTISQEAATRLRQSWESSFAGMENSHRVAVLESGMEFAPISMTAIDSQLIEQREFQTTELARIFRVPLHKLGVSQDESASNYEAQEQSYVTDTLLPIARRFEEALTQRLLFDDEKKKFTFRFEFGEILRANELARAQAAQIFLLNGVKTINEIRLIEGLIPLDGGDTIRVPLNTISLQSSDAQTPLNLGKPTAPTPGSKDDPETIAPAKPDQDEPS